MAELVAITKPDGGALHPIDIISSHAMATCVGFAQVLLNNPLAVNRLRINNRETEDFIQAVLGTWVASVGGPAVDCTWPNLLECMGKAGMSGVHIQEIRDALPSTGEMPIHAHACKYIYNIQVMSAG